MANTTIPNLPSATSLTGSEQLEVVQSGVSVKTTTGALASLNTTTGTVTSIATNAPIQGGPITTTGTISLQVAGVDNTYLAPMAPYTLKGNNTAGTVSPQDLSAASVLAMIGAGTVTSVNTGAGLTGGPITTSGTISLDPSGVASGTYGSTTTVGQFSVDTYGRITLASNQTIAIPSSQVTGLGTMATQNANNVAITGGAINGTIIGGTTPAAATFTALTATGTANLSTIASGTWNGSNIGISYGGTGATTASGARTNLGAAASGANSDITSLSGLTTPLSAPQGGTGFSSYTTGDILYADSSSTFARLNDVATGNALISGGVGVAPSWGKIGLTTHVSGTLPVANGGTGATTLTGFLKGNGTSAFTAQATIGNADLTNSSITIGSDTISLGGSVSTLAGLTTVTVTQDPTTALQLSTKQYVDTQVATVSNQTFHTQSSYATTADLGTVIYSNGTGGVNATITNNGAQAALTIDGYTFTASDVTNATRVLVKDQSSGLQNGIYVVTNEGSISTNWQLTRASDFNTIGTGPNYIETGAATFVTNGTTNGSTSWVMTTSGTIIVGTTVLTWAQTSASGNIFVNSPLSKVGNTISLGTVGVANGGTGLTSYTANGLLYAPTTASVGQIGTGTSGYPLLSGGSGSAPSFGQLSLSGAGIIGTLNVGNGGTGTPTQFTQGSIVFAGASGVYNQNNADLFWDNTNIRLGINTSSPNTNLTIVSNTQTATPVSAASLPAGTDLYILGADAANTRITQDAYGTGNYPSYTGRQARGTAASPTASQTGDILAQYTGRGYGATAFAATSNARIDMEAAENFTDTAQGTYISMHTTALGASSPTEKFRVGPDGQWGIGGATYGTSGYAFVSGGASAAPSWSQISLTSGVTGTLPATNGGTGQSSYTTGDLLYASSSTALSRLADVAVGNVLLSGGVGVAPSWGQVNLASMVTGTLPVANGGTGQSTALTQYGVVYGSTTSAMATTGAGTTGQVLIANTGGAPTWSSTIPSTAGVTSIIGGTNITASSATGDVTVSTVANPTFSTSVTTPIQYGGTTASSSLTLQSTSGSGTSDSIIFKTGSGTTAMTINTSQNIAIGTSVPVVGQTLRIAKNITGATTSYGIVNLGSVLSDVTTTAYGYYSAINTQATSFTINNITSYQAAQGVIGAGSTVNNQFGFSSSPGLIDATNNYAFVASNTAAVTAGKTAIGFYSGINTATGGGTTYGFYAAGTATNYFNGNVGIGTFSPTAKLDVSTNINLGVNYLNVGYDAGGGTGWGSGYNSTYSTSNVRNVVTGALSSIFYGGSGIQFFTNTSQTAGTAASERMRIDTSGNVGIGTASPSVKLAISSTDAILIPVGTTAQQPTGATGMLRFNTTTTSFEGYNGTAWGSIGGGATGGGTDQIFWVNGQTVTTSYSIPATSNAGSFGPITISGSATVTIPASSNWVVV